MAEFSICSAVWEVLFPIISLCLYKTSQCAYFSEIFMACINVLAQNGLKTAHIHARLTWITLKWPILWESFHKVRHPDECWSVSVVTSAQQSHQTLYSCLCLPVLTLWLHSKHCWESPTWPNHLLNSSQMWIRLDVLLYQLTIVICLFVFVWMY